MLDAIRYWLTCGLCYACGCGTVDAPLSAESPPKDHRTPAELPENSGIVTVPGVDPPCFANLAKLARTPPAPGQPVNWEKSMTQPWLVSGNMVPDIPGDVLPDHKEFYVIARCIIHKEGHVSDCNVVCSYPGVDEWIVKMILNRRYRPITLRGIPIDVVYPFRYHLEVD